MNSISTSTLKYEDATIYHVDDTVVVVASCTSSQHVTDAIEFRCAVKDEGKILYDVEEKQQFELPHDLIYQSERRKKPEQKASTYG